LVDLVEDDDGSRPVVLLETVDEFVVGCRLAVDVDGRTEIVEDLIEGSESGIVAPAVDVGGLDVEDLFSESLRDELRDTRLARAAGPGYDCGVSGFAVGDGFQDTREVIDFGVAMLDFSRDESGPEDTSIVDHCC
jgi:hypothetical protein